MQQLRFFRQTLVTSVAQSMASSLLEEIMINGMENCLAGAVPEVNRREIAGAMNMCVSAFIGAGFNSALNRLVGDESEETADDSPDHGTCVAMLAVVSSFVLRRFTNMSLSGVFRLASAVLAGHEAMQVSNQARDAFVVTASI
jgi:hypothetical protein